MSAEDRSLELSPEALRAADRRGRAPGGRPRGLPAAQPSADVAGGAASRVRSPRRCPGAGARPRSCSTCSSTASCRRASTPPGPGYLAYIPGGGLPHAAVADLVADAMNRYVGVFAAAPGLAQIEANVVRWFCRYRRLPGRGPRHPDDAADRSRPSRRSSPRGATGFRRISSRARSTSPTRRTTPSRSRRCSPVSRPATSARSLPTALFRIRLDALDAPIAADRAAGPHALLRGGQRGHDQHGRRGRPRGARRRSARGNGSGSTWTPPTAGSSS